VGLRYLKTLWFDAGELQPAEGDVVIVKTERGEEMGVIREETREVDQPAEGTPLSPIVRIATAEDLTYALELGEREKEAMAPYRELIAKNELDMKPIDVEYLFGGDKIVFYFTSEQRVDFRQLVKDLATHFHSRIDMRQMGSRDQARMIGGLGRCGDELCCARFSGEFEPVSIRMAKAQGLPPNPTKISGACGRLMCCLRYEVAAYEDFSKRAPKKGTRIETPKGQGEVVELDALREIVKLRFASDDESKPEMLDVTLDSMSCKLGERCGGHGATGTCCDNAGSGSDVARPCEITAEAFAQFETPVLDDDSLTPLPITYKKSGDGDKKKQNDPASRKEGKRGNRRRRSRSGKGDGSPAAAGKNQPAQETGGGKSQSRRRRSRKDKSSPRADEKMTAARKQAARSKGSGGSETTVRETTRVPRRRKSG
jgi:cell fate regulator YaaT (PSP1 superfamily)